MSQFFTSGDQDIGVSASASVRLLYLGWPFCILAVCGVLFIVAFPRCVGLYRWLAKVSWLGKLVSVFWWVELYFFSLECNEMSSNELWMSMVLG